jgi:hypothetical protein
MVDDDDGTYDGGAYDDGAGEPGCPRCVRGAGVVLLAVGLGLAAMGADLVSGGAITRFLTRGAAAGLASAAVVDDDDGGDRDGEAWTADESEMAAADA